MVPLLGHPFHINNDFMCVCHQHCHFILVDGDSPIARQVLDVVRFLQLSIIHIGNLKHV